MNPNDIVINSQGTPLRLQQILAQGGEGVVWKTDQAGWVAKIYNQALSTETQNKLEVMIRSPPKDPNARRNHISYAWPASLLRNSQRKEIGFLMPAINGGRELLQICIPKKRKQEQLAVDWQFLHVTALNVASLIEQLHQAGYILGDIKPQNILVNNRALPSIIDTDSFQVRDSLTGRIYRCPVASENYTPPELLGKDISTIIQNKSHDHFRLAVLIYCLLFSIDTPFNGKWMGKGDSPSPSELIQKGWWPYASSGMIQAGPLTIPLSIVSRELYNCFLRAFNQGHQQPNARPTAKEWKQALTRASSQLKECDKKTLHFYSPHLRECYWCQREQQLSSDIFYGQRKPSSQQSATPTKTVNHRQRKPSSQQSPTTRVKQENLQVNERKKLATNSNISVTAFRKLAKDRDVSVRLALVNNPNVFEEILLQLAKDKDVSVRLAIAGSSKASEKVLRILAWDPDKSVRQKVYQNPNTPKRFKIFPL